MTFPHRSIYVKILAILITIILVAILFTQVSLKDVISTITTINPLYLLAGFALYTCSYIFRAWRFHILLNKEVSTKDLFSIECVHNMMNNLLPARTGELSYVYLLKTEHNKTTGDGLATLIIARIFDFIFISIFFLLLFVGMDNLETGVTTLVVVGILLLFVMVFLLFGLVFCGPVFLPTIKKLAHLGNFKKFRFGDYITRQSEETIACFETFKTGTITLHLTVILLTIGIWVLSYSLFYLITISMHIQLDLVHILFAASFAVFSTVLPVQGIAGFGTMEGGWALGFVLAGVPKDLAISSGFAFHLLILLYTIILGGIGYVKMYQTRKLQKSL
jgi:uncharacterized protein (TIRG00374 family)